MGTSSWQPDSTRRLPPDARPRRGRRVAKALLAVAFLLSAVTVSTTSVLAADPCRNNMRTETGYRWDRNFIEILATGRAFLQGSACWNGNTAYLKPGTSVGAGVFNTTGTLPSVSKGSFVDGGGTLHIWTDMKFTRNINGCIATGWVQLRIWVYKNGNWSDGWYKSSSGCNTAMNWT